MDELDGDEETAVNEVTPKILLLVLSQSKDKSKTESENSSYMVTISLTDIRGMQP